MFNGIIDAIKDQETMLIVSAFIQTVKIYKDYSSTNDFDWTFSLVVLCMVGYPVLHLVTSKLYHKNYEKLEKETSAEFQSYGKELEDFQLEYTPKWVAILAVKRTFFRNVGLALILVNLNPYSGLQLIALFLMLTCEQIFMFKYKPYCRNLEPKSKKK